MPNSSSRRLILTLIAVVVLAAAVLLVWWAPWTAREAPQPEVPAVAPSVTPSAPEIAPPAPAVTPAGAILGDIMLGSADAPVTVIEYASFTCPHCAAFHIGTWPQFKEAYVDTGKVRFILREVYFDKEGLWASKTARCGGEAAFYPMADQFLKKQQVWTRVAPDQIQSEIKKIGRLNGLSDAQFKACMSDADYEKTLIETYKRNVTADGVKSTPTFLINGEMVSGNLPFEELSALVDKHL